MNTIQVMIVDDSAVVRKHLSDLLGAAGIEVIATAADPLFALPKMRARWPDVLVLDVEMPRMDGISFLRQLMAERPTPVVMCSTLTEAGCETTLQALAAGAVSFVTKPKLGLKSFLEDGANGLIEAVRAAAGANLGAVMAGGKAVTAARAARAVSAASMSAQSGKHAPVRGHSDAMALTTDRVIALGLSTGGVQSLERVLPSLPRTLPGMVVVQHMPEKFTEQFAARLDRICDVEVVEARNGDRVISGRVLIAPGGRHLRLKRNGAQYVAEVVDGPLINHHRPSVDVLFRSVAQCAGSNAVGLIMTGMGDDGVRGLREMRDAGAITAAQDEASSIVYGMPKEALRTGAAETVLGLEDIAGWLTQVTQRKAA